MSSFSITVPDRSAATTARGVGDNAEMCRDVVEGAFLFAWARRGAAVAWDDDLIAVEEGIVNRRADADVRHHAEDHDLIDQHVLEDKIEIGLKERRVAVLDDVDLVRAGAEVVDDLGRPGSLFAVRRALEELTIPPHVLAVAVVDQITGAPAVRAASITRNCGSTSTS